MRSPLPNLLADFLETALGAWAEEAELLQSWSDEQVLQLCTAQMDAQQSERLGELLDKQQEGRLTEDEKPELWTLMRIYEHGQLRKAQALAEAARRGLQQSDELVHG